METFKINGSTILKFTFGPLKANCYLLASNGEVAVIDPTNSNSEENALVFSGLKENGTLKYIINTHGHFDHIIGNAFLKKEFPSAKLFIHPLDRDKMGDPSKNGSAYFGNLVVSPDCDEIIDDGSEINLGNTHLKFLHTPGHTKGSVSIIGDGFVFTGDTLFQGTIGIAKEYKGAFKEIVQSIKNHLAILPPNLVVLPGHGENSKIGEEVNFNPFLQ